MTDQADNNEAPRTGGLTITDKIMRSEQTAHTATAWPVPGEPTLWTVTWLPGRNLTRNQAITAMTIALLVGARGVGLSDDPVWPHVDSWAAELGLSGPDAVVRASEPVGERESGQ